MARTYSPRRQAQPAECVNSGLEPCSGAWERNAPATGGVLPAMFAREYLSVVSRWAREQLRRGAAAPAQAEHLKQLIEAADALGADLAPVREAPANVVSLEAYRRRAS